MVHDLQWLKERQSDVNIPRYFTSYFARPWVPKDDAVVERFFSSLVRETGGIILYDMVHAINSIRPGTLELDELKVRSKYHPDMIRKQAKQLEEGGRMGEFDPTILEASYNKVRRMYRVKRLKPLDLGQVPYQPDSSAGLPTLLKKADVYDLTIRRARRIRKGMRPQPAVAFHRGKNDEVARFVSGYPAEMSLLEGRFFYPYQQEIIQHHTPYAGGRYDFELAGLINEIRVKSRFFGEWDYHQFDSSISASLIKMAFSIIGDSFEMTDDDKRDWDIIQNYFIYTPMLFPDGMIYYGKDHGVPSGSNFTQLVDSIVNSIVIEYVCRRAKIKYSRYYVMGDDVIIGLNKPAQPSELEPLFKELGINLDTDKKSQLKTSNQESHFLGHDWSNFIGVRLESETLERLVTPERGRNEYWSNDKQIRVQAYIERIKSYQDDNMRSFCILQELIEYYRASSDTKKDWYAYRNWQYVFNYYDYFYQPAFNPNSERNEVRWKDNKATVTPHHHRGKAVFI